MLNFVEECVYQDYGFVILADDVESQFAPCSAKVYQLRPQSILFDPVIRKLVNESNGTFVSGQKIIPNPAARPETLKLSRQYR